MGQELKDSLGVYIINALIIVMCFQGVVATASEPGINPSTTTTVVGVATAIATSIMTLMGSSMKDSKKRK